MRRRICRWTSVFFIMAAIFAAIWFFRDRSPGQSSETKAPSTSARSRSNSADEEAEIVRDSKTEATENAAAREKSLADWEELLRWLRSIPPPTEEEIRARLLATRMAWVQMDPQELADMIRQLLESGVDAQTGMDFQVGLHGLLAGWPTLRVFLLDVLATADPEMAAAIAGQLLDQTTSPDEFATALKSLTREGLGRASDSELVSRFGQMLENQEWQGSRGFAEAFDLARTIGSPEAAQRLVSWDGNQALKNMAMHEFAAEHPEEILSALEADERVIGSARASLMARANPEAPTQIAVVDQYLRDPERTAEDAAEFLKLFPLRSATTGYRLYGKTPAPYNFEQIKTNDRAAFEQVSAWATDPAFEKYRPEILGLQKRLAEWIAQAAADD
jgi:hypothetical protein